MTTLRILVFLAMSVGAGTACAASDNFWTGTWKPNLARSSPTGPTSVITLSPQGMYTYDNGRFRYTFRCDGHDYPSSLMGTLACTMPNPRVMDTISKENGRVVSRGHSELSLDGKTQSFHAVVIHADGTTETKTATLLRLDASSGFAGSWRSSLADDDRAKPIVLNLRGQHLRLEVPGTRQVTEMTVGGPDARRRVLPPGGTLPLPHAPMGRYVCCWYGNVTES